MKLFKKLTSWTWTAKFVNVIRDGIDWIRDYNLVAETFYGPEFKGVLGHYLKTNFKKDWVGRIYAVVNPNINEDGRLDFNNVIIELDDDNTNSQEYVTNWVYKQMNLISTLFKLENLYDYISCDIEKIDDFDNFLVVFRLTSRKIFVESLKRFFVHTLVYGVIAAIIILFII